jgi:hypothetical protein
MYELTEADIRAIGEARQAAYDKARNQQLTEEAALAAEDAAANKKTEEIMAAHQAGKTEKIPATKVPQSSNGKVLAIFAIISVIAILIGIIGVFTPGQRVGKEEFAQMVQVDSLWKAEYANQMANVKSAANEAKKGLENRPTYDQMNNGLDQIQKVANKALNNSVVALQLGTKNNDRIDTLQLQIDDLREQVSSIEASKLELLNAGFVNMQEFKKLQTKQDLLEKQLKDRSKNTDCKKHELKGMLKGTFQGEINVNDEDRD